MPRKRDESYIDEDYRIHEWWMEFAANTAPLWHQLGGKRIELDRSKHIDRITPELEGEVNLNSHKRWDYRNSLILSNFRYDRGLAARENEETHLISSVPVAAGRSYTFDRSQFDEDTTVTHEFEYALRKAQRSALNQEYKTSIRNKTTSSVSASADIGPAKAEASVVNETEVSFESAIGLNKEEDFERSFSDKITEEIPIKAGKVVQGFVQANRAISETKYTVKGYLDADIKFFMYSYAGSFREGHLMFDGGKQRNIPVFTGIEDLLQVLNGYDLRYPRMKEFHKLADADSIKAWDWLENKENRMISAPGTERREDDENALVKLVNIK